MTLQENQAEHLSNVLEVALHYIEIAKRRPWCSKWRVLSTSTPTSVVRGVHLAPLALLTLAAHARYCIRRARVTTPPTLALLGHYS